MKGYAYAYAIGTFHIEKTLNVFKIKILKRVMCYNGVQSQRDELALSQITCKNTKSLPQ